MTSSTGGNAGQQGTQGSQSQGIQPSGSKGGQGQTGTPDPMFDLISVLYHCLDSAATCQQYVQDAQGDQELTQFFQQCVQGNKQTAEKAKQLLARRLASSTTGGH